MTKSNFLISFMISALFLAMISCNSDKNTESIAEEEEVLPEDIVEMRDDQIKLAEIELGFIEMRSLSSSLKVNGMVTVSPQSLASICIPLGGFIKSTTLMPGDAVSKGQTLAILENQEFVDIQQSFFEAKYKLEYAEAEYKRHSELYKEDVYSEKNLQQVTADYKNLKAQVKALEQKLLLIGINPASFKEDDISSSVPVASPISGYVKTVSVNIGKFVNPSDILFEIVNTDKLLLELTLFEMDADKAAVDQRIHFFINNETEQHEAVIYQTGKSINSDKTFKVYATVQGDCKNVLPGMYVNAVIALSDSQVPALPSDAIVSFDDKNYIFIFDKEKEESGRPFCEYKMVEVQKGVSSDGYTEIILTDEINITTAKVVIKGAYNLLSAKKNAGEMAC